MKMLSFINQKSTIAHHQSMARQWLSAWPAHLMQPGDTCWIRKGAYRETIKLTRSGQQNNPITFTRYNEERVILDGSDPVNGPWVKDPSEAPELAKRLGPASIPLIKHDRRYEDQ
jgi:hypothetical protein